MECSNEVKFRLGEFVGQFETDRGCQRVFLRHVPEYSVVNDNDEVVMRAKSLDVIGAAYGISEQPKDDVPEEKRGGDAEKEKG